MIARTTTGVRFSSVAEDSTSMPEEPHALRGALSALGDPRAEGLQGLLRRPECFEFSRKAKSSSESAWTPASRSTFESSATSLKESASEGEQLLPPGAASHVSWRTRLRPQGTECRQSPGVKG